LDGGGNGSANSINGLGDDDTINNYGAVDSGIHGGDGDDQINHYGTKNESVEATHATIQPTTLVPAKPTFFAPKEKAQGATRP
jgi:hypothetical protein